MCIREWENSTGNETIYLPLIIRCRSDQMKVDMGGAGGMHGRE